MLVKIISIMLKNTYTTDALVERLGLMRKYYGERLFVEGSTRSLEEVVQGECDQYTVTALKEWVRDFDATDVQPIMVYEALDTVQEELTTVPSVTLYVPVRFKPEQVEGFGKWLRANVQPNILMSLHIDPRATGGCGIIWKHVYHDLSLHYFIEKDREAIFGAFNTHLHGTTTAQ